MRCIRSRPSRNRWYRCPSSCSSTLATTSALGYIGIGMSHRRFEEMLFEGILLGKKVLE